MGEIPRSKPDALDKAAASAESELLSKLQQDSTLLKRDLVKPSDSPAELQKALEHISADDLKQLQASFVRINTLMGTLNTNSLESEVALAKQDYPLVFKCMDIMKPQGT